MSTELKLLRRPVLDTTMAYREAGDADAPFALFLHGNPTSSYIWRNIMPRVAPIARCVAPDLVGFGESAKPDCEYRFFDHVRYLDAFIAQLGIESAYLIAQDWGTALALHLAARRPRFVRGLAFMEFIRPMLTWNDFHQAVPARELFQKFRTPVVGEQLIMDENVFVERVLPGSIKRTLGAEEMAAYRTPFPTPQSRQPIWRLANDLPIGGEPADVHAALAAAHEALVASTYPKVLFVGEPGALVSPVFAEAFSAQLRSCRLVKLGLGAHYLQEDHPEVIGKEVGELITRTQIDAHA